ncbi:hypothetical protein [Candidatus Nitrospira allomarina]|jgi:hypothetical protein|uniref:Uncharacterized protein n=1 Tax=Candidatus Nitrospira allomarina TaxID=3020900 RepID=A0AA96GDC1_9BACT|nr:hypothetical protein [Candidatus Nitrospira allomarina]WNM58105.1 hypothetical protein PP769_19375 [Candidatus Nitrospira allomarina]
MKVFAYVLVGVLGGIGIMMFSAGEGQQSSLLSPVGHVMAATDTEDPKPWTGDDLLEMAQIYDQQADELQMDAVRIEQRATSLMLKPHMDPKGFQRTSLMHVASSRWKAARDLREMAVMHRAEGQRLLALKNPDRKNPERS